MEYRTLGGTGLKVSAVSLGTEYLIDRPRRHVVGVVREAIERGVNYFDLFFAQPAFRDNMGAAFAGRRDKALLAAHLGAIDRDGQYAKTRDLRLSREFFEDFLTRYRTDYTDVLFLHNCDAADDYGRVMSEDGLLGLATRFKKEGKARFIGFSAHTVSTALRAAESGCIDVLMFTINAAGNAVPGRRALFAACAARGVGLVAMKPYAGGKLLTGAATLELERFHLGGEAAKLTSAPRGGRAPSRKAAAVRCISYILAQTGVSTVVPGCKNKRELQTALAYFNASSEERDFTPLVARYKTYVRGECVYCNHCLPCPSKIDIGATLRALDASQALSRSRGAGIARSRREPGVRPWACTECGACVKRCPFGVEVTVKMREAAEVLKDKAR